MTNNSDDEEYEVLGKEGIVFVIDATEPMFDCQHFSLSIRCVENVMKNKAIVSPLDELAVILFGTNETKNSEDYEHIFTVQSLNKISVESILEVKELTEDFSTKFGHNNEFSLAEVFAIAIEEFNRSKTKFDSKKVILLTNCCDPHSGDSSEDQLLRKTAIIRAQTFDNYNIEFELIPMISTDKNKAFDINSFYGEAFPELKLDFNTNKIGLFLNRIYIPLKKTKKLASLPFHFGTAGQPNEGAPEVKISVDVYNLYSNAIKPPTVPLNRNDLKELKFKTQYVSKDLKEVSTQNLVKSYSFGNDSIILTKNDEKFIKDCEEPALTLLGFKDRSALLSHFHIKPGLLILPNESSIEGNTTLFMALLKQCAKRNKIPICRLILKIGSPVRLVALYPQIEDKLESKPLTKTQKKQKNKSIGFYVIYLPYKEDIRQLELKDAEELQLNAEALELAQNIVNKLTFDYIPKNFPNPVLETHWRVIEGVALNQVIEPINDKTQPNYEDIEEKAGYDLYSLNQKLGGYKVTPISRPKASVKIYEDLSHLAKQKKLGTLTVAELKEFCKLKKIEFTVSRKAEVIEAIYAYYSNK